MPNLIYKEIYMDEVIENPELWDRILDEVNDEESEDVIVYVLTDIGEDELFAPKLCVTPVDFNYDMSSYDQIKHVTEVLEGNIVPLPAMLVKQLGWKVGDKISFEDSEDAEDGAMGVFVRKSSDG